MKKYIAGILTGILLMSTSFAFADINETINVYLNRVKLVVNGELTETPTMLYEGRTYIQLASAAEVLNVGVHWDGTSNTAFLTTAGNSEADENTQNFRHIVVWDFKQGLSEEEKDTLFNTMKEGLENLVGVIGGIIELNLARDILNPGTNKEGQLVLNSLFESEEAYEAYAVHPAHLEIAEYVRGNIVENRRAADYFEPETVRHADKFRHVVIWDFKDGLDDEEKDALFNKMKEDLEALVDIIPQLLELILVRDHYNTDGNGQLVLNSLFDSIEAYTEIYVPHPMHQAVVAYVGDIVQNRRAADFFE